MFMLRARLNRCDSVADMIDINVYNYLFLLAVYLLVYTVKIVECFSRLSLMLELVTALKGGCT